MTSVTTVDGGYLHEWIDADGEHHKYVHPTSLAHPAPSGQAMTVKPLEWWTASTGDIIADSLIGRYRLGKVAANENYRLETPDGLMEKPSPDYYWPKAEAKAAAQADYERRILSAIAHPVQPGWRDVESAPKDGTSILAAHDKAAIVVYWQEDRTVDGAPGWADGETDLDGYFHTYPVFVWQPLPPLSAAPQPKGE
ncbi:MAG: hypothetical protein ACTHKQ_17910 [Mesorhizobium sp.]